MQYSSTQDIKISASRTSSGQVHPENLEKMVNNRTNCRSIINARSPYLSPPQRTQFTLSKDIHFSFPLGGLIQKMFPNPPSLSPLPPYPSHPLNPTISPTHLIKAYTLEFSAHIDGRRADTEDVLFLESGLSIDHADCHGSGQSGRNNDSDDVQGTQGHLTQQGLHKHTIKGKGKGVKFIICINDSSFPADSIIIISLNIFHSKETACVGKNAIECPLQIIIII